MNDIEKARSMDDYHRKSPPFLHKLEQRLKESPKILLFPVHLPKRTHFDGFKIDFKQHTLAYGMSTHPLSPALDLTVNHTKVTHWNIKWSQNPLRCLKTAMVAVSAVQ